MQGFVEEHRSLIQKHARAVTRAGGEKIPAEDVARELELVLQQLGEKGLRADAVEAPDAYLRATAAHSARRARRRRTLIDQIAAGDDLQAVSDDLAALDADLPERPRPIAPEAKGARDALDAIKRALSPPDALIFAVWIEDESSPDSVTHALSIAPNEVAAARERILEAFARVDARGSRGEGALRELSALAAGPSAPGPHVDEPILALLRGGDMGDDIADAVLHAAVCFDCRARLTEGEVERRAVVVMAIEAAKGSQHDLARAAQEVHARLVERGDGRWTAVIAAEKSESFAKQLQPDQAAWVERVAMAKPVDLSFDAESGRASGSGFAGSKFGTDAAEVQAWAKVAREPRRRVAGTGAAWAIFAIAMIFGAAGIAYWLASR